MWLDSCDVPTEGHRNATISNDDCGRSLLWRDVLASVAANGRQRFVPG
jgi:hypothetical protein